MTESQPGEYDGKCLFCGKEMKEHFHSGSYETYTECDCRYRKAYFAARCKVRDLYRRAEERLEKMQKTKQIIQTYKLLHELDPERKLEKKALAELRTSPVFADN